MKHKFLIVGMSIFTVVIAVCLFISLICGAPVDGDGMVRYVLCALGMSILLPTCFTLFFFVAIDLSEQLEEYEKIAESGEKKENQKDSELSADLPIPTLVNALAKEKNLTPEEKERLLSYLEDL